MTNSRNKSSALMQGQFLKQAVTHHKAGQLQDAERLYRAILQAQPQHPDANHNLGILAVQAKQPAAGLPHFKAALEANPSQRQYWLSYIDALIQDGQMDVARTVLLQGRQRGLQGEAVDVLASRLEGPSSDEINKLVALFNQQRYTEGEALAKRLTECFPQDGIGWKMLGAMLKLQGRSREALEPMRKAVELLPRDADAHSNLGVTLQEQGRLTEAEASCRRALEIKADFTEAYNNLGNTLKDQDRFTEAEASYRRALEIMPDFAKAHYNLGITLKEQGRITEAKASYLRALEIKPDYTEAQSNLLFALNDTQSHIPSYCLKQARHYGRTVAEKARYVFSSWQCEAPPKHLRVGFVSGDLHNHPVGYFLEGLLAHIDPACVELIAYPTHYKEDKLTARLRPYFTAWKPLLGYSDEAAAHLIHSDGIHLLLDLSGHTARSRLPLFAWKPAPVQASWLGYFATTGVREMDYLLGDPYVTPVDEESHFTEAVWRLPESYLCFTPPDITVKVGPLPALSSNSITFGCFNNLTKMNDAVVALWSRVLKAVPGSRLFLKTSQLKDLGICDTTRQRFAACGIPSNRLMMEGPSPRAELLAAYRRVDIALDPFPYPGGTTSVEGLWMGVPVLTRRGNHFLSHLGESIAHNAGLVDWIAADDEDYVSKAVIHTAELERLAVLRASLRPQVLASPVFDSPRFARHFEAALWGMWGRWQNCHRIRKNRCEPQHVGVK